MILKLAAALALAAFAWTGDENQEGYELAQQPGLTVSSGTPGGWTMPRSLEDEPAASTTTVPSPEPNTTEEP